MNHYLVTVTCQDGDHEHRNHLAMSGEDYAAVQKRVTDMLKHDASGLDDADSEFGFGDGLTRTELNNIQEITLEQYELLRKLGVA